MSILKLLRKISEGSEGGIQPYQPSPVPQSLDIMPPKLSSRENMIQSGLLPGASVAGEPGIPGIAPVSDFDITAASPTNPGLGRVDEGRPDRLFEPGPGGLGDVRRGLRNVRGLLHDIPVLGAIADSAPGYMNQIRTRSAESVAGKKAQEASDELLKDMMGKNYRAGLQPYATVEAARIKALESKRKTETEEKTASNKQMGDVVLWYGELGDQGQAAARQYLKVVHGLDLPESGDTGGLWAEVKQLGKDAITKMQEFVSTLGSGSGKPKSDPLGLF